MPSERDDHLPPWKVWMRLLMKAGLVLAMGATTICFGLVLWVVIFADTGRPMAVRIFGLIFLFAITVGSALMTWRIFRDPMLFRRPTNLTVMQAWLSHMAARYPTRASRKDLNLLRNELNSQDFPALAARCEQLLAAHPEDIVVLSFYLASLDSTKDYPRMESICDRILGQLKEIDVDYAGVYTQKLHHILEQRDFDRFLAGCKRLLEFPIPESRKLLHLDQLACNPLYLDQPDCLEMSEFCARKALDICPGNLTLQGTLGGILVERGQIEAAEPLLHECYTRSGAEHDRGISAYYLALIFEQKGEFDKAEKLGREALSNFSEPWFTTKVEALLKRLENNRGKA